MKNNEYVDLTTDSSKLVNRLKLNSTTQEYNFSTWLYNLMPEIGEDFNILDLGCGTGTQTKHFLELVGGKGSVCALDASEDSINSITADPRLKKHVANFDNLPELKKILSGSQFDLINSTYAIYYSEDPLGLIEFLRANYLSSKGRMVITGPTWSHELYRLISNEFGENPDVTLTINFMESLLTPFLRETTGPYELHYLNNISKFSSVEEATVFIKSTTYGAGINPISLRKFLESLKTLSFRKTSLAAIF
jgi:ubiquinone/menaquinone biosynthesis C-methylase UbiE